MAAGTVGYTDTRGNKDYTSIIAGQIGRRLKEASNMAGEERAYAAGMAEAGGTSLEEAGIGKGYFFGRALGSRFGGDRIARTKGRMGVGGAGTNPATNYKQRFRGGFDYNVTNQNITDVAPLSNALVVGLRGVQEGLTDVAGAIQRQGTVLNSLSRNQADMAKATMFNGYLFAMFQNQQKQSAGRDSLRREERSLEGGRGFGRGGGIGGASFGGAGGGRGMINVTPGGAGGGRSGGSSSVGIGLGGGLFSAGTSLLTSEGRKGVPIAKSFGAATGISNALGMGTVSKGGVYSTDVLRAAGRASKGFNPARVSVKIAELIGDPSTTSVFSKLLKGGDKALDTAEMVAKSAGAVTATRTGVKQLDFMMDMAGAGKQELASEMLDAGIRSEGLKKGTNVDAKINADIFNSLTDRKGKKLFNRKQVEIFKQLGLDPGQANLDRYLKRISSTKFLKSGMKPIKMRSAGESAQGIAEAIKKYYPNTSFKNLEEAVVLTEFARKIEQGVPPDDAVKFIRGAFGSEIADNVLIKGAKTAAKNSMVGKALGKAGSRSALKKIPLLGAVLGTAFALDRARKGDFLGAGLEFSSGMLGLIPGLGSGLGFGIDGFLLARDLGMTPMRTGGTIYPGRTNSMLNVGGRGFSFNEPGNKEVVRVEKDTDDRFVEMGTGIVEGFKKKKSDYIALNSIGVERGLRTLGSDGFFSGLFKNTKDITNNLTSPIKAIKNIPGGIKNWFMKGFRPGEDAMSWKDLLADDWKQRGKFGKGGKLGGWDITRGFRPGVPASEGGMMSGPTPAGRQSVRRLFGFLSSFRGGGFATLASMIANDFINPQPLADGTMEGYLKSVGQADTSGLAGSLGTNGIVTPTIINNNYYNNSAGKTDEGSEDATIGMGDLGMDAFMVNYSLMTK